VAEPAPPAAAVAPTGALPSIERVTPVLPVQAIEPVVSFWEGLGFVAINPSRVDGRLEFIAFAKDGLEVHYQAVETFEQQFASGSQMLGDTTALVYLAVDDLDAVIQRLGGAEVVIPRRQTAWGSDEIYVREPGGHLIGFATFGGG